MFHGMMWWMKWVKNWQFWTEFGEKFVKKMKNSSAYFVYKTLRNVYNLFVVNYDLCANSCSFFTFFSKAMSKKVRFLKVLAKKNPHVKPKKNHFVTCQAQNFFFIKNRQP